MAIGFLLDALKTVAAFLWPAYLTHKTLQYGTPAGRQKWTVYWCVIGFATGAEFLSDYLFFWLPLYRVSKILFAVYLWHPQTEGAYAFYARFLSVYLRENENRIDATADDLQIWLQKRSSVWKEQALIAFGRGAVMALEKVQELGSPRSSPRIAAGRNDLTDDKIG